MNSNNKKSGNQGEKDLCELLREHGIWAHRLADKMGGQPFDIIAVKNNTAIALDSKICETGKFMFSRVEPNQETAMQLWKECGNDYVGFALWDTLGEKWRFLLYDDYKTMKRGGCKYRLVSSCRDFEWILEAVYGR